MCVRQKVVSVDFRRARSQVVLADGEHRGLRAAFVSRIKAARSRAAAMASSEGWRRAAALVPENEGRLSPPSKLPTDQDRTL